MAEPLLKTKNVFDKTKNAFDHLYVQNNCVCMSKTNKKNLKLIFDLILDYARVD